MNSLVLLLECIGIIFIILWVFQNKSAKDDEPLKGILAVDIEDDDT